MTARLRRESLKQKKANLPPFSRPAARKYHKVKVETRLTPARLVDFQTAHAAPKPRPRSQRAAINSSTLSFMKSGTTGTVNWNWHLPSPHSAGNGTPSWPYPIGGTPTRDPATRYRLMDSGGISTARTSSRITHESARAKIWQPPGNTISSNTRTQRVVIQTCSLEWIFSTTSLQHSADKPYSRIKYGAIRKAIPVTDGKTTARYNPGFISSKSW